MKAWYGLWTTGHPSLHFAFGMASTFCLALFPLWNIVGTVRDDPEDPEISSCLTPQYTVIVQSTMRCPMILSLNGPSGCGHRHQSPQEDKESLGNWQFPQRQMKTNELANPTMNLPSRLEVCRLKFGGFIVNKSACRALSWPRVQRLECKLSGRCGVRHKVLCDHKWFLILQWPRPALLTDHMPQLTLTNKVTLSEPSPCGQRSNIRRTECH